MTKKKEKKAQDKQPETKEQKFVRLAKYRVPRLSKLFDQLAGLSNRATYDFTEDQVDNIFRILQDGLDGSRAKFNRAKPTDKDQYSFEFDLPEDSDDKMVAAASDKPEAPEQQ